LGDLIVSMAGTPAGEALALALAMLSALAHAIFGAINKGGRDPIINRGAINVSYALMALPVALFVVDWPTPELWAILFGAFVIHILFEWLQARSFQIGGFTVVYPIARGTGPLIIALASGVLFGETFGVGQWLGLLLLTGAIYGLAWANLRALGMADVAAARQLRIAVLTAVAAGAMIAVYTLYDAWGIRQAADPFTFIAWFFVTGAFGTPVVAALRWRRISPEQRPEPLDLALRGFFGGVIALLSFGGIMLATRLGAVAEVAALRETSIVFATAIGVLIFHERIDALRLALILLIVAGAVVIKVA
jgi:drug/metabolite transporter (DMT)-like permease